MNVYEVLNNRAVRIIVALIMVVCLTVVPIDFKMKQAEAAITAALLLQIAIYVGYAMLIVMGFAYASGSWQASVHGYFEEKEKYIPDNYGAMSLADLIQDILDNVASFQQWCYGIFDSWGASIINLIKGKGVVVNAPFAVYEDVKKYLDERYKDINDVSSDESLQAVPGTIIGGGMFLYPEDIVSEWPSIPDNVTRYSIGDVSWYDVSQSCTVTNSLERVSYNADTGVGTYKIRRFYDGTLNLEKTVTALNISSFVVMAYDAGITPESVVIRPYFYISKADDNYLDYYGSYGYMGWLEGEYVNAVAALDGGTGITVDEPVFEDTGHRPPYLKVYDDYTDLTYDDIGSTTPFVAGMESNIVNSSAQTLTWTGEIPDCPIDDLEASLTALGLGAVIGNWVCKWADSGTTCDISCTDVTTGAVTASISSDVSLTWDDVLTKIGYKADASTDVETGVGEGTATGEGTIAGEATLDMPTSSINLEPLKITGDILTTRFPFSLPWDIYNAFTFFFREEETDKVVIIPLDMGVLGKHDVEFDLSPIFDSKVIMVSRYGFYVLFVLGLILATNKLIGRG